MWQHTARGTQTSPATSESETLARHAVLHFVFFYIFHRKNVETPMQSSPETLSLEPPVALSLDSCPTRWKCAVQRLRQGSFDGPRVSDEAWHEYGAQHVAVAAGWGSSYVGTASLRRDCIIAGSSLKKQSNMLPSLHLSRMHLMTMRMRMRMCMGMRRRI